MPIYKEYHLPKTIEDALHILAGCPGSVRIIAGGTDLILDIQQGRHPPVDALVDVTNIPELKLIEQHEDYLYIGAGVPLNQIIITPLVNKHAEALVEACRLIGGPQVRNVATLGGNIGHALPAGDGTIALLSLGAKAEVARNEEKILLDLDELFAGPGQSALNPVEEILTAFLVPLSSPREGSAFRRVMRPQGVAIAILNMSVWVYREDEKVCDVRVAVGPSGPVPKRAIKTEEILRGKKPTAKIIARAKQSLVDESIFRTSRHRASSEYRKHLSSTLLETTFEKAWVRAGN